jgi:hypothetical protein
MAARLAPAYRCYGGFVTTEETKKRHASSRRRRDPAADLRGNGNDSYEHERPKQQPIRKDLEKTTPHRTTHILGIVASGRACRFPMRLRVVEGQALCQRAGGEWAISIPSASANRVAA